MKKTIIYIGLMLTVLIAGCSEQNFPGCCTVDEDDPARTVPFLETFLFNFKTGSGPITTSNPDGNLNVISQAVLLTLLSAAQEEIDPGTGVVAGVVLSNGAPVQNVALRVTDAAGNLLAIRAEGRFVGSNLVLPDGLICPVSESGVTIIDNICIKGDLFYNSLGGVPDFSNNRGTSAAGSFSVFNLPPGEVYLWASRGGRGSARITVFDGRVSVGKMQVVPIPVSTILVQGNAVEAKDESTPVTDAAISILGTQDPNLTTTSDAFGFYTLSPVGAGGRRLMKVAKSGGYWTTYHNLDTIPFQSTIEIPSMTRNLPLYDNAFVNDIAAPKGGGVDTSLGIITGRVQLGDGTTQHCAKISVTDAAGTDLLSIPNGAVIVYNPPPPMKPDPPPTSCSNPTDPEQTGNGGFYFIYNLPPGEVFLKYTVVIKTGGGPGNEDIASGGLITTAFPGVVFVQDLLSSGLGATEDLSGFITDEALNPAPSTQITVLGIVDRPYDSASQTNTALSVRAVSNAPAGDYLIEKNSDPTDRYPLIGGTTYRFKTSKTGVPDTYQRVTMAANSATKQDLLSIASLPPAAGKGRIYGNLIDQVTGRLATDVTLEITDLAGNLLERITSATGVFQSIDLSPGLVNLAIVSGDDSGNMLVRIYPNGVSFVEFTMSKVIPASVDVFGGLRDFDNSLVPLANLTVAGRIPGLFSPLIVDGGGNYTGAFESNSQLLIKAQKSGFYDTYNSFPQSGLVDALSPFDLFAISRSQMSALAAAAGVQIDNAKGIIVGKTVENSFDSKVTAPTGCSGAGPFKSAVGFFNQDSSLDMAVINCFPNSVTVFFGNASGDGTFAVDTTYTVGTNPTDIAAGDFDGDGIDDLVVSNFVSTNTAGDVISFSVLLGDKKGGFTADPLEKPVPDSENKGNTLADPTAVVAGFFDSDALLDIVVSYQVDNVVQVYLGKGDGTFTPNLDSNGNIDTEAVGTTPVEMVTGDFNDDGRLDLAVANQGSDNVSVLLGSTGGSFTTNNTSPNPAVGVGPVSLISVDLNGDGQPDLAVVNQGSGTVTILTSNVGGAFSRLQDENNNVVPDIPIGGTPTAITWGDFNGDNRVDLAVSNRGANNVSVHFGDGDGQFTKSSTEVLTITAPDDILAVDVDRNGLHDLFVVGADLETLLGTEQAVGGISVEARDLAGVAGGSVVYPSGGASTAADGVFVVFNVPPDLTFVRATQGGAGNSMMNTFADAVSYTKIKTVTVAPFQVSVNGKAYDPVGPSPGVPVGNVEVEVLGMGLKNLTDSQGNYAFNLDANSEYVFNLFFEDPS